MESKCRMTKRHFTVVCLTHSYSVKCDCNRCDIHWDVEILKLFLTLWIALSLINVTFVYFLFKRKVDAYFLWLFSDLICIPCVAYKTFSCVVTAGSLTSQTEYAATFPFECLSGSLKVSFIRMLKTLALEKQNKRKEINL